MMDGERPSVPSPDGAAARSVNISPDASAALSFADQWKRRWACRRLDRLARELRRQGWATERRYGQNPPVLHVFPKSAPLVGDSISVVREPKLWWFRSSTGAWLGQCTQPWRAADSITMLMAMWGITPRGRRGAS
ncbi:hypothetical protein GCM10010191_66430 [Actinomadura vinacea]|uniref:Transposase n=1 Tax=Actinomadura vinacea TaxID=115336 RepID=A0ABN3JYE5_9ACTN